MLAIPFVPYCGKNSLNLHIDNSMLRQVTDTKTLTTQLIYWDEEWESLLDAQS